MAKRLNDRRSHFVELLDFPEFGKRRSVHQGVAAWSACAISRRRHHDGKASQASPWYRRSSAPRNPGAPPRLQCQQAPSLRWPPPPKSPSISMAPSPGGGHPRTPPTKRSQINRAFAAPRQLRWRLGRRQPRRTTAEIVCSGRALAAGHANTSTTTSTSAEEGDSGGKEAWPPEMTIVRAGGDVDEGRGGR